MKSSSIKLLIMDVDGTLTDGKINISNQGELFKSFSIKDGLAIHDILPKHNILPVIITGRQSNIVKIRCEELGIDMLFQGVRDKVSTLKQILGQQKLDFSNCAYIGDDLNDLDCMNLCAVKGCPKDAADEVKASCDFVSTKNGGDGAVREFIEYIINND